MPQDTLTFSVRLHDPAQKTDASKSTCWFVCEIPREDLKMGKEEFAAKWITPNLEKLKLLS